MALIDTDTLKNIFFWGFIITILAILVLGKLTRDNVILILIITIVVVLLDILYRTYQEQGEKQDDPNKDFPSDRYMDSVGGVCPDYWTVKEYDRFGNPTCQNTFGIPVVPKTIKTIENEDGTQKNIKYPFCFSKDSTDTVKFKKITWPIDDDKLHKSLQCNWVRNCGPADGTRASWIGIDSKC